MPMLTLTLTTQTSNLEVTPEAGNNYVGVNLLFPKSGTMTRGHVTARKRDAEGNPTGVPIPTPSSTHVNTR